MNITHIQSEFKGLIEYDAVLPIIRIKFVSKARYDLINNAFYNINYFRR